jgi:pyrrolidone-carboxylate peptidase
MRMMITGFGPFLEHSVNLSEKMLYLLKEDPALAHHEIETVKLPVEFGKAFEVY